MLLSNGIETDNLIPGSKHFKWHEALWLPSWQCHHIPSDEEQKNIIAMAEKMDLIREFLNTPLNVHVWIRPILNNPSSPHHAQDYNHLVGGATHSEHKVGNAVDYDPAGMTCDEGRAKLMGKLQEFGLRMEKNPGSSWIHNDRGNPNPNRYFIP